MTWVNFLVSSKYAKNTEGIESSEAICQHMRTPSHAEAYYCVFDCQDDQLKHVVGREQVGIHEDGKPKYKNILAESGGTPTFEKYEGPVRPHQGLVPFDFDSDDVQQSLNEVRSFLQYFDIAHYQLWFSGSKGFHLYLPVEYFEGVENLTKTLRNFAHRLKSRLSTIDTSVYNANRKFRAPNSRHPKTKLYKIHCNAEDPLETITQAAERPGEAALGVDVPKGFAPSQQFLEELQQASVEQVSSDKTGTCKEPTEFEKFDDKVCVQRLLTKRCPEGQRNSTAIILANDFYRTGRHKQDASMVLEQWAQQNGLPESEMRDIIRDVYNGVKHYNHGCQEPLKAAQCSGKCPLYNKISPEKRPNVVDASKAKMKENEDAKKPSESLVVDTLLQKVFGAKYDEKARAYYDSRLIKYENNLFMYDGTRWVHFKDAEHSRLKTRIDLLYSKGANNAKIESAYKRLMNWVPPPPPNVEMFKPNPYATNFREHTLHMMPNHQDGTYKLDLRGHSMSDYLTNKLDLDFQWPTDDNVNHEFVAMLGRMFENDADAEEKIEAIGEMFGACLMPAFPHLFFLHGRPLSGKSTLCIILSRLITNANMCGVQPHEFNSFNMSSMVGKHVNLVTDIKTNSLISDDVVKQIEDRQPVRIRIKNKDDIYAPLPAVHIFGAQRLPKTLEGSGAHARRWSIISFNNTIKGNYRRDYAQWVFDQNPGGILNFALQGLQRLASRGGIFKNPASGSKRLENWQRENDLYKSFFKDIENNECTVKYNKNTTIKAAELFNHYKEWLDDTRGKHRISVNRSEFYREVEEAGYKMEQQNGSRVFRGFQSTINI